MPANDTLKLRCGLSLPAASWGEIFVSITVQHLDLSDKFGLDLHFSMAQCNLPTTTLKIQAFYRALQSNVFLGTCL